MPVRSFRTWFSATAISRTPTCWGAVSTAYGSPTANFRELNFAETALNHLLFERCKGEFANFAFSRLRTVRFAGCPMHGAAFGDCRFERVEFAQCDLTQAEFFGTRLRGLSFADSDIRGIRVREIGSFELKGLKISPLQAVELARLLGVEIEE